MFSSKDIKYVYLFSGLNSDFVISVEVVRSINIVLSLLHVAI